MALTRTTNIIYISILVILCILGVVSGIMDKSGLLLTFGAIPFTVGTLIAWVISLLIDHAAKKNPPHKLTPAEMQSFKRKRLLVIIGLAVLFFFMCGGRL